MYRVNSVGQQDDRPVTSPVTSGDQAIRDSVYLADHSSHVVEI